MSSIGYNNLHFAKKLTDAGMPQQQAEILAESIHDITTSIENNFATKKDFLEFRLELKSELKETRNDVRKIENNVHELKANVKLLNWMMGFLIAGVTSLVMKAFF